MAKTEIQLLKSFKHNSKMEKQTKITILWIVVMCGLSIHSLADLMPLFWGEDITVSQDGNTPTGLLVFMMTITYLIPVLGILCVMFWNKRMGRKTNAILATVMALFNAAHCFELLDFTPVQVPMLVGNLVVSVVLCVISWHMVEKCKNGCSCCG